MMSLRAPVEALVGDVQESVPVISLNNSPRDLVRAWAGRRKVSLPGWALASAINSATVLGRHFGIHDQDSVVSSTSPRQ